jgi:Tol biopolymer transport system component
MGEVYRALDPRLDRDVAIKVLPPGFADDEERLLRFEREAKVLASLNHENIAVIYGLEEADGTRFIVMELVEGETLADRIAGQGMLDLDQALDFARQIGSALQAAHDSGVVHRDLKPANIQVTEHGKLKVLDFGLARPNERSAASGSGGGDPSQSPTMLGATGSGVILGTAAYMSPEQARGKPVDRRADIWAFGAVLYEMLTGERAFAGEDLSETLAAVIRDEPDLGRVPPRVRELLDACLQKDPTRRLRDIGDAWRLLREPDAPASVVQARVSTVGWAVAALATLVALGVGWVAGGGLESDEGAVAPMVRFELPWAPGFGSAVSTDGNGPVFSLSPNGSTLAFAGGAGTGLWLRRLDSLEPELIDGTEGATYPFWSPDGDSIGFFAEDEIKKVSLSTSLVQSVGRFPGGRGGTWSAAGTILVGSSSGGLYRVESAGGTPQSLTALPEDAAANDAHRYPQFLPDGSRYIYLHLAGDPEVEGVYLGSLDGGAPQRLLDGSQVARFLPPRGKAGEGHLLFRRGELLMAAPFRPAAGSAPAMVPVADGVGTAGNTGYAAFSVSTNGTLAYSAGLSGLRQLTWFDRTGNSLEHASPVAPIAGFELSSDESRVAFTIGGTGSQGEGAANVWLVDLPDGSPFQFTFGVSPGWAHPVWSPDDREIAFSTRDNVGMLEFEARRKPSDLSGSDTTVATAESVWHLWDWSPDGRYLLLTEGFGTGTFGVFDLEDGTTTALADPSVGARAGQFSSDGHWVAYTGAPDGVDQIYVRPFPDDGPIWQVSRAGGHMPRWSGDTSELFYRRADGMLMSVTVDADVPSSGAPTFRAGSLRELFGPIAPGPVMWGAFSYSPSADGERFLINTLVSQTRPPITMVLNWVPPGDE